jgi:DNA-binding response OmpR family regulator
MAQFPMVLIIDDSMTSRLLMANALQKAGYDVITASDGSEGRMKAFRERPRCIILDVVLPGVDGFKLCRQLRAQDPNRKLSIIMVSVKNTTLDHTWGLRQGADRYLPKPFSAEALIKLVGEVIAEHS